MRSKYLLPAVLALLSCPDEIVLRSTADYYPEHPGSYWQYRCDTSQIFVALEAETTVANYEAGLYAVNGEPNFRTRQPDGVLYYFDVRVPYGGYEYSMETRYRRWLALPIVAGRRWSDTVIDSIEIAGQWVKLEHRISGQVVGFEDHETPAGAFSSVYHVEIVNVCRISSSIYSRLDSVTVHEYYAPDVGVVVIDSSGQRFDLEAYYRP
jgi:hypothetical protein